MRDGCERETERSLCWPGIPCDGSLEPRRVASWSRMESRSDAVVARRSTVRSPSVASSSLADAGGIVTQARSGAGRIAA
eukprot:4412463-Pleurochrysis_carterae.AAC.2